MPLLTMRQAAAAVGRSRQTIYRMAESGALSVTQAHDGQKMVDTSELLRVFGQLRDPSQDTRDSGKTRTDTQPQRSRGQRDETAALQIQVAELRAQLAAAEALFTNMNGQLARAEERERQALERERLAREQAGRLLELVERQTLLLAHQPGPGEPESKPSSKKDKRR